MDVTVRIILWRAHIYADVPLSDSADQPILT